jgi:ubiquitin-conjugating enzyme E2 A
MRDFKNIQKEIAEGFTAASDGTDIKRWTATVIGPPGTPWERGIFRLSLGFPDSYPYNPPTVQFLTPVSHSNVYPDGLVCLDILQRNWSPLNDATSILISILKAPEHSDPIFLCEPGSWAALANGPPFLPSPCERLR